MDKDKLLEDIGQYSGNRRLDVSECEEPRYDDEQSKKKWIEGERKVRIKRKLKRWRNKILDTTRPKNLNIHLVGQSHIDCAWMWRYEQTRKKAQVTFNKAIFHSNVYPDTFLFALSQPILLEWIKEDNPDLFYHIQEKVLSENIELVGGSYVEPDCMMPSGEAMVRQRLYGMRFYNTHFGKLPLPKAEWFLDSFGYNFGLPQILAKSGAQYLWTSKLTWNRDTTFPFVNFWWEGPDGTRLLAANFHYDPQVLETWEEYEIGRHFLKADGKKVWSYADDYSLLKKHVQEDEICPHVGFFFGQSDGGHGPTYQEVAEANKLSEMEWFEWSSVESFFKGVGTYAQNFPIWNDELYLEFHRGCFSNHNQVKRYNRKFETLLPALEKLAVLSFLTSSDYSYPRQRLENLWKTTLKNQFHDVLPGSSIPEVYDDCWEDWLNQESLINELLSEIGKTYSQTQIQTQFQSSEKEYASRHLILFNPLSWTRTARIFIPITLFGDDKIQLDEHQKPSYAHLTILDEDNVPHLCQPIAAESDDLIDPRPAGWWTVLEIDALTRLPARIELIDDINLSQKDEDNGELFEVSSTSLSNECIRIALDSETGAITETIAKDINNNLNLLKGKESNLTFGFLDNEPIQYHAWNLTPEYWKHPIAFSNKKGVELMVVENGPVFKTIRIQRMLGKNPVIQKITLFKSDPLIYFDFIANWQRENTMLKVKFAPNFRAKEVMADGMYCAISSKVSPDTPCDKARFEKICHKYIDMSTPDKQFGLALLNEGKYAFDVRNGELNFTMLRACRYPETAPEAWVNKERELNEKYFSHHVPKYSGLGPFSCRYALYPHKGGTLQYADGAPNVDIHKNAEEFNNPVMVIPFKQSLSLDTSLFNTRDKIIKIIPENVVLTVMKMNEWDSDNSLILRFYETCGSSTQTRILFGQSFGTVISSIESVDLLERSEDREYIWDKKPNSLRFTIGAFEIVSFRIFLN
jgi:alpha-mannosidase